MEDLPRLHSIVSQTVVYLRSRIAKGHWVGRLPSERLLTAQLQVSRNTVRAALSQLSREGIIRSRHGSGTEIVGLRRRRKPPIRSRDVALLTPESLESLQPRQTLVIDELRSLMNERGCRLHVFQGQRYFRGDPGPPLTKLVRAEPHSCWILNMTNQAVQKWFQQNRIHCVVSGTTYPGIDLPFSDLDHRAICRHAVGVMLRSGHTRIAYLAFKSSRAGDQQGVEGFLEGADGSRRSEVEAHVVYHESNPASIRQVLVRILEQKHPPTALLVANAYHFLAVPTHLSQMGWRIPQDISIVSRDDSFFLNFFIPAPTRYAVSPYGMAKCVWRLVLDLLEGGIVARRGGYIMPKFIPGGTLAPLP